MKGLELAREFYSECRPIFQKKVPEILAIACAGLAGEGSECFGCDDETSQDHDFGAAFCLWLPAEILNANAAKIQETFKTLPPNFKGHPNICLAAPGHRRGPRAIEDFYGFFSGLGHTPQTCAEWLAIPEYQLAAATNGEIFEDNGGAFSAWRQKLLDYYPRDVWLKKLATACMRSAQAGQYNMPRALARGDGPSAMLAAAKFSEAALALVFLLNRRYMPFYKWAPRLARDLPVLGPELGALLDALAEHPLRGSRDLGAAEMVEDFCVACAATLRAQNLSQEKDSWLWAHGPQILSNVKDAQILKMDLLKD